MKTNAIIQMSINYKYVQTTHTHNMFYMVYTCTYTHVLYGLHMHIHTFYMVYTCTYTHVLYGLHTHTQHVFYGLHTHTCLYGVHLD